MTTMKPQLANDANLATMIYPCGGQPKIDGVRALNTKGTLTGRSLDPFKGTGITEYFSKPEFVGLDGEMILGNNPASADRLCSASTGAMGRFKGVKEMPDLHWYVFDYLTPETCSMPYQQRYLELAQVVSKLSHERIHMVPRAVIINNVDEAQAFVAKCLADGFEGAIFRNLTAAAKEGRPSKKLQELARVKPWMDSEMLVTGVTEGAENTNEAKTNTLGRTERSSAQAGMVGNKQVGSVQGTLLEDVISPITGAVLFVKGLPVTVGSGEMSEKEALYYFANQSEIVGHICKFKHLAHGTKDLPRMGTFVSLRMPEDMS